MQSMSLHAVMSDSSVHLQLCLDIKDFHICLPALVDDGSRRINTLKRCVALTLSSSGGPRLAALSLLWFKLIGLGITAGSTCFSGSGAGFKVLAIGLFGSGPLPNTLTQSAVALVEKAGGVRMEERLSLSKVVLITVDTRSAELEQGAPGTRRAPAVPLIMIASLELAVMDEQLPRYWRAFAWTRLFKVWTSSRTDDLLGVLPGSMHLGTRGLRGVFDRTKTSGAQGPLAPFLHFYTCMGYQVRVAGDWISYLVFRWFFFREGLPGAEALHETSRHAGL